MITATTTWGSFAGANPVNHACGAASLVVSAVPVFPATCTPAIWAEVPVPDWTTPIIMSRSCSAVAEEIGVL